MCRLIFEISYLIFAYVRKVLYLRVLSSRLLRHLNPSYDGLLLTQWWCSY